MVSLSFLFQQKRTKWNFSRINESTNPPSFIHCRTRRIRLGHYRALLLRRKERVWIVLCCGSRRAGLDNTIELHCGGPRSASESFLIADLAEQDLRRPPPPPQLRGTQKHIRNAAQRITSTHNSTHLATPRPPPPNRLDKHPSIHNNEQLRRPRPPIKAKMLQQNLQKPKARLLLQSPLLLPKDLPTRQACHFKTPMQYSTTARFAHEEVQSG